MLIRPIAIIVLALIGAIPGLPGEDALPIDSSTRRWNPH